MGGVSIPTNFDEYNEDTNRYCWSFRSRTSDDDETPPEPLPADNSACLPEASIKRQDSSTLIDASLSSIPLREESGNPSVTPNTSPVRPQRAPYTLSPAYHQSLALSTSSESETMPLKRKTTTAKVGADQVQPQRKSTRTSKPTAKKATATETPPPAAATKKPTTRGKKAVAEEEIETDDESDVQPQRKSTRASKPTAKKVTAIETRTTAAAAATKKPTARAEKAVAEEEIETDEESDPVPNEALSKKRSTRTKSATPAATATKKPTTRGKKAAAQKEIETEVESDVAPIEEALSKKRPTRSNTSAAATAKKPTTCSKKAVAKVIKTDVAPIEALSKNRSTKSATPAATATMEQKTSVSPNKRAAIELDDGSDNEPDRLPATPPSKKRMTKSLITSPAITATEQKKSASPSKRSAAELDDGSGTASDKPAATPPSKKKKKSLLEEATATAGAAATLSRSPSPSPEPAVIPPPAADAQETEPGVSQSVEKTVATVESPLRDEEDEAAITFADDEETGDVETEDEEAEAEAPEDEDEEETSEGSITANKDTATADTPHASEESVAGPIIDIPEDEDAPENEAVQAKTKTDTNTDDHASTGMPLEGSASSEAPAAASALPAVQESRTTSLFDPVDVARRFNDAQATLKRITPSITNLMMAAMKDNRASADVYPAVQPMVGQAYALKLELERIDQTLERVAVSVEILDRDFGRLADEARKSGLTNWK
ncbi:hypothetical protein MBLNU457_5260t1 [Dothideomycetes sp. NU457]